MSPKRGSVADGGGGVAAAAAPAAVLTATAAAESAVSSQVRAAGLEWAAGVPAERLPAPDARPVICLIDTGVAVTPDTPADNPPGRSSPGWA